MTPNDWFLSPLLIETWEFVNSGAVMKWCLFFRRNQMARLETMVSDKLWHLLGVIVDEDRSLQLHWSDGKKSRKRRFSCLLFKFNKVIRDVNYRDSILRKPAIYLNCQFDHVWSHSLGIERISCPLLVDIWAFELFLANLWYVFSIDKLEP